MTLRYSKDVSPSSAPGTARSTNGTVTSHRDGARVDGSSDGGDPAPAHGADRPRRGAHRKRRARPSRLRALLIAATTGGAVLATAAGAQAVHGAAGSAVATWQLNERGGTATMRDSSGNGLHGKVGGDVLTGRRSGGSTGYRFPRVEPNRPPTRPGHLVIVPDNSKLDPGWRDYAVTIRVRTKAKFGNIIQKGQSQAEGGYFKFQNPSGRIECLFRGSQGSAIVRSGRQLNDGAWHTIRCARTGAGLTMYVDGSRMAHDNRSTGHIANAWPISIGGKPRCNQVKVTCDYFAGDIDSIRINAD